MLQHTSERRILVYHLLCSDWATEGHPACKMSHSVLQYFSKGHIWKFSWILPTLE